MIDNVEVSVICNAYNHEKYIAQTLESFVMQRTSFKFEVLVHDDASTDGTADIIREYEKKYPELIKPIYQTENQYQKGGGITKKFQYSRAKGKYYAFCEGDDYWTDPLKLQKQYDLMEQHPEVDMCSHGSVLIDARTNAPSGRSMCLKETGIIPTRDVIAGGGAFVMTNSLFFRASVLENEPKFRSIIKIDYTMQVLGSLRGGMLYIAEEMSADRKNVHGSWTQANRNNIAKKKATFKRVNAMLRQLDKDTNRKYHDIITKHRLKNWLKQRSLGIRALIKR